MVVSDMAKFKVGQRVSVPLGSEMRVEGKIVKGPYPADAEYKELQMREYGLRVANIYDVAVIWGDKPATTKILQISATHVRRA